MAILLGAPAIKVQPPSGKEKGRVAKAEVTKQVSPELERAAARRARDRANAARWDLDVAVFFFSILATVMILSFQGIGVEVTAPASIFGLAMGWLMGWRKGKQTYERFYDEELSKLEKELEKTMSALEEIIEERVQKARGEKDKATP